MKKKREGKEIHDKKEDIYRLKVSENWFLFLAKNAEETWGGVSNDK